jgi:hypothetical protein
MAFGPVTQRSLRQHEDQGIEWKWDGFAGEARQSVFELFGPAQRPSDRDLMQEVCFGSNF